MNTFGTALRISSWGSSHGAGIGVLIDGLPAGVRFNEQLLLNRLAARAGGGLGTPRKEADEPRLLSGIENNRTNGDPVAFWVENLNTKSKDYDDVIRPAHADGTWRAKFGRPLGAGGGRASARESLAKVIAGAMAAMFLEEFHIRVYAALCAVGGISVMGHNFSEEEFHAAQMNADKFGLCALGGEVMAECMKDEILSARAHNDSCGASVAAGVFGAPAGLGQVLYDKLDARLAQALMGLNAVKAVEIGAGAKLAKMLGSQANDEIISAANFAANFSVASAQSKLINSAKSAKFATKHNYAGGILGGISTGESIQLRAHFKPTPSIAREQIIARPNGELFSGNLRGRHDPCVGVRGVVIVRSLIEHVIADMMLLNATAQLKYLKSIYKEF